MEYLATTNSVLPFLTSTAANFQQPTEFQSFVELFETNNSGRFDYLKYLNVTLGSLGTAGNLFVFAILLKNLSKSPSMTECLILNQSFVDMMTSLQIVLSSLVLPVYNPAFSYVRNDFICRFWSSNVIIIKLF